MTNFGDIFKNGFLENIGNLTTEGFLMSMLSAFISGMIVYFIYRKFFKGVIYNNNFNILLVLTCLVTCFIVLVISSNVVLSLGMVGALSIVRYRTAIKDPLDVGFLFWSVAVGVTSGAGLYLISLLGTVFISIIYVLLIQVRNRMRLYLLVIKFLPEANETVLSTIKDLDKVLKNKTSTRNSIELTYEVRINTNNTAFMQKLTAVPDVESAVLVEFTGDYYE